MSMSIRQRLDDWFHATKASRAPQARTPPLPPRPRKPKRAAPPEFYIGRRRWDAYSGWHSPNYQTITVIRDPHEPGFALPRCFMLVEYG